MIRAHTPVDGRNLRNEALAVAVFQIQNIDGRPVKVIGHKGYLLEQAVERVAYASPGGLASTVKVW